MAAKLYQVEKKALEPHEGLVDLLEKLLSRAKEGKLVSLAFAAEYERESFNGDQLPRGVEWGLSGHRWNSALLGGLEILKHELCRDALK